MKKSYFKYLIKTLLLLLYVIPALACSHYPQNRGIGGESYPDFPLTKYVAGHLGVINPKYKLSYLIIAYRYLSNHPLSTDEQQQVISSYEDFFSRDSYFEGALIVNSKESKQKLQENFEKKLDEQIWWEKLSDTSFMALDLESIMNQSQVDPLISNAPFDKFTFASLRLRRIIKELETNKIPQEKRNSILLPWILAQQKLLQSYAQREELQKLIDNIATDGISILQLEKEYMYAVSYFKSEEKQDLIKASELFCTLAKNNEYPWQEWVTYLQYRALTRAASLNFDRFNVTDEESALMKTALGGMQQLADNAQDPLVKRAALDYKDIINGRLDIMGRLIDLLNQSAQNITTLNFSNILFYDQVLGGQQIVGESSEILLWLSAYLSNSPATFQNAYRQWHKMPDNVAWLLVALNHVQVAMPTQQEELFKAAEQVKSTHPGFYSIRAAWINAMMKLNKNQSELVTAQRELIDNTLATLTPGENYSTTIYFSKRGLALADKVDKLINYGIFIPSTSLLALYPPKETTFLPYYSLPELSEILNRLPLSVLTHIAKSDQVPEPLRPQLYAAIWARATLLGKFAIADQIASQTMQLNPVLADTIQLSIKTSVLDERQKLLISALLDYPELKPLFNLRNTWDPVIDDYEDRAFEITSRKIINSAYERLFWCAQVTINKGFNDDEEKIFGSQTPMVNLLTSEQKQELASEEAIIKTLPDGAQWIAKTTAQLAKKHPKDPHYAKLLAKSVEITRTANCYDHASYASKQAFLALHQLFPMSKWAKRTKYYY